jgi:hypothetical protein
LSRLLRRFAPIVVVAAGTRPVTVSAAAVLRSRSRRRRPSGTFVGLPCRLRRGSRLLFPGRGLPGAFLLVPGFVAFVGFLAAASLTSMRPACVFLTRTRRIRGRLRRLARLRGVARRRRGTRRRGASGVLGRTPARVLAASTIRAGAGEWGE